MRKASCLLLLAVTLASCDFLRDDHPLSPSQSLNASPSSVSTSGGVGLYQPFERSFSHSGSYGNPYTAPSMSVTFTDPSGRSKSIDGFWDGGNTWRVRFSPDKTGRWTYRTSSADSGLNGHSGTFDVVNTGSKGSILADQSAPYHFRYQDGSYMWWFGETNWSAFASSGAENLNRASVLRYVDVRAAQRFNVIHSAVISQLGWGNEGGMPFNRYSTEEVNPGYFREMDSRLRYMNGKGITAGLFLAWGHDKPAKNEIRSWDDFASDAARLRFARYVVARYSAWNVFFVVAGEWDVPTQADKDRYAMLGREVMNRDPHDRLIGIHAGEDVLGGGSTVEEFATQPWMSFGDYSQNYVSLHQRVLIARDHAKPVVNGEYAYYLRDQNCDGIVDKLNSAGRSEFRQASYDVAMAGAYFVTGFARTYYGGNRDCSTFNVDDPRYDGPESDLVNLRKLFTSVSFWKLQPRDALLSGPAKSTTLDYFCLADIGREYVVYTRGTSSTVTLSLGGAPSATYSVKRFDPRSGTFSTLPDYVGASAVALRPPDNQDWAFVLTKR